MDDRFFTACFPGEANVCGRALHAFTPYHYLLLKAIQSPILDAAGANRPSDLLAAVTACMNKFGDPIKVAPSLRDFWWKHRMERNPKLFEREIVKFSRWTSNHSSGPRFWEVISGGGKTRDLTGPDILTLIVPLIMKTNMSESEVWNMSLGRAQWLSAEIQEIEGSDRRFLFDDDLTEETPNNA